jgi:cytochrome c-type biogenesis protein CcmH/NrfG
MSQQQTSSTTWALIAVACLVLGLAVGYVIFGQRPPAPVVTPVTATPAAQTAAAPAAVVDEQQVQLLKNILSKDPANARANVQLGNLYFDAGRYTDAVGPYRKAFDADPKDVNVSTDLGTALWYSGRPDEAIAQFDKSLAIDPTHPQTLFNLGIVKRDGKQDPAGAVQAWEKLLAANPSYVDRDKVQQLLEQLKQQVIGSPLAPVRSTK